MDAPENTYLNPHLFGNKNRCKSILAHIYFSKFIQLLYIVLIVFCIFDLIWTLAHYSDYPYEKWAIIMDFVLNVFILLDSTLRWYMYGCQEFCNFKRNFIEIFVFILTFPEVIFLTVIISTSELSRGFQIGSLIYGGIIIVLRPIVFCKRQKKMAMQSIRLPGSIVYEDHPVITSEPLRIDSSEDEIVSFNARGTMEFRNSD
ncbi:hypothetical protein SteCoe_7469 [Stentor coeruleus]|uniref:Ion transport domain-containing protein n=1 Tax=Stentor coeruleus TaxID=5963 RepID=A0A1R2CML1_9CILI|nr:hypothetical protein SteCoe_7469 [Stentor coeruleus]